ncbi:MAG TPA: radical SAM protein [Flexistipes sinusarabici]|uniref:Radical SAM protein n=1 Tax=Flexistipes sinusarabici TaxID=2352 RepID=A0A3D5QC20_FLESI|nr:radical SAM protein [Flexistipes sinusarabici]
MNYIFGPVPSRRLGRSLGVDVIGEKKICTLDCLYCELGKTTKRTVKRGHFVPVDELIEEFSNEYEKFRDSLDVVTITASGEPTLNIDLKEIALEIKKIIHHPLAVLTNSTLITEPEVREALHEFDIVVPSLDAADEKTFRAINRPSESISLQQVVDSLILFSKEFEGKLYIEVLLLKGINDSEDHLNLLADIINSCDYDKVQLNTAFRPGAYREAVKLNDAELLNAAMHLKKRGIVVEPVENFVKTLDISSEIDLKETLLQLINMRPCSYGDLRKLFGMQDKLDIAVEQLVAENSVRSFEEKGETFYVSPFMKL